MILELHSPHKKSELDLPDESRIVVIHLLGAAGKYPKEETNRNIFRVAKDGRILWRVGFHDSANGPDPFVGVRIVEDGKIQGFTWEGWRFEINHEDGSLKNLGWSK